MAESDLNPPFLDTLAINTFQLDIDFLPTVEDVGETRVIFSPSKSTTLSLPSLFYIPLLTG
jgi:hypothetical protein